MSYGLTEFLRDELEPFRVAALGGETNTRALQRLTQLVVLDDVLA